MYVDIQAIWITIQLAFITTLLLLMIGLPLALWLANTRSRWRVVIEALTAMPLVLPPTVLGFYLLILFGNDGAIGQLWSELFGHPLSFTFTGLVFASLIYSLPFVVQPLQGAFERADLAAVEAAYTLGASKLKAFWTITMPQARRGVLTATVLGFAHTVGEFGVVLMVGGNIPGQTKVVSIAIYEHVEALEYGAAHQLSLILLVFSFVVLLVVYAVNRQSQIGQVT